MLVYVPATVLAGTVSVPPTKMSLDPPVRTTPVADGAVRVAPKSVLYSKTRFSGSPVPDDSPIDAGAVIVNFWAASPVTVNLAAVACIPVRTATPPVRVTTPAVDKIAVPVSLLDAMLPKLRSTLLVIDSGVRSLALAFAVALVAVDCAKDADVKPKIAIANVKNFVFMIFVFFYFLNIFWFLFFSWFSGLVSFVTVPRPILRQKVCHQP